MYKIYCDDNLLYSHNLDEYSLLNPKVDVELNKIGSFTFKIYPKHPNYDKIKKLKSIITVYKNNDSEPLFRGHVLDDETGLYNEKQVTCEGELAFLIDSIQRPYNIERDNGLSAPEQLFAYFINKHNEQVDEAHKFKVGIITVTDPNNDIVLSETEYVNTWDSVNKKLIEIVGGYLKVRHESDGNYIDYLDEITTFSDQTIEFGKNLLDIKKKAKGSEIGTAVIPLGAKIKALDEEGKEYETDERLTIKSVNNGKDYIYNQEAVNEYRWIFKTVIFDDISDALILKSKGEEYLAEVINLPVSIDLTAVDLTAIKADINAFNLGTNISIKSAPHNLSTNMLVTKLSIDLLNPQSNKLTVGKTYSTFTEQNIININNIKQFDKKISKISSGKTDINEVKTEIVNTCYTKAQADSLYSKKYTTDTLTDAINKAVSTLGERNCFYINITDSSNKYYFATLFYIKNSKSVLTKIDGDLTVTSNISGDLSISNGTTPYKVEFR